MWYRDLVSGKLNLGSCCQKGSLEVMVISVDLTTEESGFDPRRRHVFIISSACRPFLRVTSLKRWVVSLMCATFKNARSSTSLRHFVVVRSEILVQGQHYLTSYTRDMIVEFHLEKWRPVLASSVSFHADILFDIWILNCFVLYLKAHRCTFVVI